MANANIDDLPPTESKNRREDYPDLKEFSTRVSPTKKRVQKKTQKKQKANIKFVGKKAYYDLKKNPTLRVVDAKEVPTTRINGHELYKLPNGVTQRKGWYSEDVTALTRTWPMDFKRVEDLGGK